MSSEIISGLAKSSEKALITAKLPKNLLVVVQRIAKIEYNKRNGQMARFLRTGVLDYVQKKPEIIPVLLEELEKLDGN